MKNIILFLAIIFIALSFNACKVDTQVEQQSQNETKLTLETQKLFEHYFNYNMYSNYKVPAKIHEEIIDLVAKANKVSPDEFQELYEKYYRDWYNEKIKTIK